VRVLKKGFGLAAEHDGRIHVLPSQRRPWQALKRQLADEAAAFGRSGHDWQSTVAQILAARSLGDVLRAKRAPSRVREMAVALRGFYLADPDRLSALVAVEQTLGDEDPGRTPMFRIRGGNDRLVDALARESRATVLLNHAVRAVTETASALRIAIERTSGEREHLDADYMIVTAPAAVVREWHFEPALRDTQRRAFEALWYGHATKVLLRFDEPWWRRSNRPRAFGSNLPIGAVWESAEDQRGAAIVTLLAGGRASSQLRTIYDTEGAAGLVRRLHWLGRPKEAPPSAWSVTWEADPWARGGYAVFGTGFDPALRFELARAHGRVLFAGEHTSRESQGYMNGAVESGERAVRELEQLKMLA
jgi:monoamine oxidase